VQRPRSGRAVRNSGFDSSVKQVCEYLQANARDPDSIQYIAWSQVQRRDVNKEMGKPPEWVYTVTCKFRAKNGLGRYNVEEWVFTLDATGNVLRHEDLSATRRTGEP
jgi:hypothetical protein